MVNVGHFKSICMRRGEWEGLLDQSAGWIFAGSAQELKDFIWVCEKNNESSFCAPGGLVVK